MCKMRKRCFLELCSTFTIKQIHAIGAGALVAEIQENSNLTYRLYDYDRVGKDGKKRELHIGTKTDVTRLISARMATEFERGLYYGKNE